MSTDVAPVPGKRGASRVLAIGVLLIVAATAALGYWWVARPGGLPGEGTELYEQTTRSFYRGLAGLQVGLTDGAKDDFRRATESAPGEPAVWANLGLAHLRLAEFEAAAPAVERAASLAPSSGDVIFLQARLETSRGRREEGIALLRRAVELDPRSLQGRTALAQEVENSGGPEADAEAQRLLDELLALQPRNAAILVERARLAAKRNDVALLRDSVVRLEPFVAGWPVEVVDQFRAVQTTSASGSAAETSRAIAFLRNVLARVPAFLEDRRLVTPSAELIADPFTRFLRLPNPSSNPSAADEGLNYATAQRAGDGRGAAGATGGAVLAVSLDGAAAPVVFVANGREVRRVDGAMSPLPFPGGAGAQPPSPNGLVALDWNHDFRLDLVAAGAAGVRLFLQGGDGAFVDATATAAGASQEIGASDGVWPADIEMDGDLDVVVGRRAAPPLVLRNNGDGTWRHVVPFPDVLGLRSFGWGDLDGDGDPDAALIDEGGRLLVYANMQAGQFRQMASPASAASLVALSLGDLNADGALDVVTMARDGAIRRASIDGIEWREEQAASWARMGTAADPTAQLILADLDNNGALDVLASGGGDSGIWLAGENLALSALPVTIGAAIASAIDMDDDGVLDLAGAAADGVVMLTGRGTKGYHFHVIRPRAQTAAGDQRINSFGIGGEVEVRAGRLVQKQTITGSVVHMGLGTRTSVDVTRIVWPNGVPQAEFEPAIDQPVTAEQRLKGSCPWIFADDGSGLKFVTDFLWRSPLGLRINAQDTAGVTQTEDWVKIRGEQLVARDGQYDIRISAELWETHFVDHVSLMAVDHPADVEIFVDERFSPVQPPALAIHAVERPIPVVRAVDQAGADVTDLVRTIDGRYLSTFERGPYQGVASDHFVEIDLGASIPAEGPAWLIAQGWVYPTDSSINVAIAQGGRIVPQSLSLEVQAADGTWKVISTDLGFPAGKSKTILIDLQPVVRAGFGDSRRLRLRTNLEIYWDSIAQAKGVPGAAIRRTRLSPSRADLRYRGYSVSTWARDEPEIPVYDRLATTTPRWRDLVGYHTRFGDVRELLSEVEDRYVIMNAGDELRLSFAAPAPPEQGWTRDFVLVGDGWVKDGDFNTGYSKTVLPLPEHGRAEYEAASAVPSLESDPVYQRHPEDWERFHTRFVSPRVFLSGLRGREVPAEP